MRGRRRWIRRNRLRGPILRAPQSPQVRRFPRSGTTSISTQTVGSFHLAPPQRKASTATVSASAAGASNSGARTAKSDGVSTSITGDKTRDKCIEMLYDALALESGFRMSFCLPLAIICFTYIIHSVRPHIAACSRSRGDSVQGFQRDHGELQVEDTDVVCKPQGQEQPWLAPKCHSWRYPRPDICKND